METMAKISLRRANGSPAAATAGPWVSALNGQAR
jgi:hypothetical protein